MDIYKDFVKKHSVLICIDSDGCAMDTMDIKHKKCFGPEMVREWKLDEWADPILARWDEINLYTLTRGVNRFKGLAKALTEINETYKKIDGVEDLRRWAADADELSERSLEKYISEDTPAIFEKALAWSRAVNRSIASLPDAEINPFKGVRESLQAAGEIADVAIVSSANPEAVKEEWTRHGLIDSIGIMLAQNAGSKAACVDNMIRRFGYAPHEVLLVGDAPGDLAAAEKNGVRYFPILVKKEEASWKQFREVILPMFAEGRMTDEVQAELVAAFRKNLEN